MTQVLNCAATTDHVERLEGDVAALRARLRELAERRADAFTHPSQKTPP